MITAPELMTANELLTRDSLGQRTELVRGQLVVREPAGLPHASLLTELTIRIGMHVRASEPPLGYVFVGEPGFWVAPDPDTVRAPDLAFVLRERLPDGVMPGGFFEGVPDLAVEIRSPSDRTGAVLSKIGTWLDGGCAVVWVIDPVRRTAQHYAADGTIKLLGANDALDAEPVLDGLSIALATLWQNMA